MSSNDITPTTSSTMIVKIFLLAFVCGLLPNIALGQIGYTRHLSELRIRELHNIANRMEYSINNEKYACDNYYDYVCSRNRPLYSVLGHLPEFNELMQLLTELQQDREQFDAKQKLMDFFISCHALKSIEQCYYEAFEYYKPLFGYIITKNHIDGSSREHENFISILETFIKKADRLENFSRNPIRTRLSTLLEKFRKPHDYFRAADLNSEYKALRIYRESYKHNILNLEQHRKRNSTYESGISRTMLDWSLYVFQSRNKPMSYYFPTLNVHLWMTLYNSSEHQRDQHYFQNVGECLKLPQFVNVLEEARIMAVVYLKSFRHAWQDYHDWLTASNINKDIFDQENQILKAYQLNNKRIFFTLFAQNFCEFGKELAENVFYLGLKYNQDFFNIYSCGYLSESSNQCV